MRTLLIRVCDPVDRAYPVELYLNEGSDERRHERPRSLGAIPAERFAGPHSGLNDEAVDGEELHVLRRVGRSRSVLIAPADREAEMPSMDQITPPDSSDQLAALANRGRALISRYETEGHRADLDQAIKILKEVACRLPPGSARALVLCERASAFRLRYDADRHRPDLNRAIELFEEAVAEPELDPLGRQPCLNNLGMALRIRFERDRNLDDVDRSIEVLDDLIAQTPDGAPQRPDRLNSLALALQARYAHGGALSDIVRAIRLFKEAAAGAEHDAARRLRYLNNLGGAVSLSYDSSGNVEVLEESIAILQDVVAQTPEGDPHREQRLKNLANVKADLARATTGETKTALYRCPICGRETSAYLDQHGWPIGHVHRERPSFTGVLLMLGAAVGATVATWVVVVIAHVIAEALLSGITSWEPSELRDLFVALVVLLLKVFLVIALVKRIGHAIFWAADRGRSGNPALGATIGLLAGVLLLFGLLAVNYFSVPSYGAVLGDLAGLGGWIGIVFGLIFSAPVLMAIVGLSALIMPAMYAFHSIKTIPFCVTCHRYMRATADPSTPERV